MAVELCPSDRHSFQLSRGLGLERGFASRRYMDESNEGQPVEREGLKGSI